MKNFSNICSYCLANSIIYYDLSTRYLHQMSAHVHSNPPWHRNRKLIGRRRVRYVPAH